MGNGNSRCTELVMEPNAACNIGECAENIRGQRANSASPSDIWVVTMRPNTNYETLRIERPINLKIFISPRSPTIHSTLDPTQVLINPANELRYETLIYEYVVNSMLHNMLNPFFVQYYGGANGCTFDQLYNNLSYPKTNLSDEQRTLALLRSTFFMSDNLPGRPSITDIAELNPANPQINGINTALLAELFTARNNIRYGLIATARSIGIPLSNWIQQRIHNGTFTNDGWVCIIQVVSALAALEGYECAHNDIHHGNLFVEDGHYNYRLVYDDQQQNVTTSLNCRMKVCLYDWDRSYVTDLGNNPLLTNPQYDFCTHGAECNEYIPQRDLTKFMLHLLDYGVNAATRQSIIDLLCSTTMSQPNRDNFINNVVNNVDQYGRAGHGFMQFRNGNTMQRNDYIGIRTPKRLLSHLIHQRSAIPNSGVSQLVIYNPELPMIAQDMFNTYIFTTERINDAKHSFMTTEELEQRRSRGEVVQRMEH